jgi:glycine dehydrogenase subunit 1
LLKDFAKTVIFLLNKFHFIRGGFVAPAWEQGGHRFLPLSQGERKIFLEACGAKGIEDFLKGIPPSAACREPLNVGPSLSESEIKRRVKEIFQNPRSRGSALSFLGAGIYDHECPAVVNQLTLRGEFLTAYTPYQPEMAQGTLQALFEFQSMVAEVFGMEVSNASHYDGSTSFAEAALMALRLKPESRKILVSAGLHPEYQQVLNTYLEGLDAQVCVVPLLADGTTDLKALESLCSKDVAIAFLQNPNFFGCVEDVKQFIERAHTAGTLAGVAVPEPLSLGLLESPGALGADIAVGEGQSFGLPQSFGGPYVGLFTAKKEFVRQMPGRLCGETVDAQGRRSYALTLSTREQHIRREKATSNICTNQNLCALWATIWLSLVGKQGFADLAYQNLAKAEYAKEKILSTGVATLRYPKASSFNEFTLELKNISTETFIERCVKNHYIAPGVALSRFNSADTNGLLVAITEKKSKEDIDLLVDAFIQWGKA